VEPPMALNADAVDANTGILEHLDHPDDAIALLRAPGVEVVVIELRIRRVLMRKLECEADELVAVTDRGHPLRRAILAVFADDLVDDVPGVDTALVTPGDHLDVMAHALDLCFARVGLTVLVEKEPLGGLVVPDEGVADDEHVVFFAELDKRVGGPEVVDTWLRIDRLGFEDVFCGDAVEVDRYERLRACVLTSDDCVIDCGADQK